MTSEKGRQPEEVNQLQSRTREFATKSDNMPKIEAFANVPFQLGNRGIYML